MMIVYMIAHVHNYDYPINAYIAHGVQVCIT